MKKKYIAGVSGGPDSMAMLYRYRHKITLVCHVNYHKRKSALRDQKIVEKFCHSNHIPLKVLSVTQKLYDEYKKKSKNFQTLARLIRYDFFVKCAKRAKCEKLLIAHNADDFCETAMMQQLKKSKALFYGIKSKSHYQDLIIVRPLIHFRKVTLLEYCRHKKIPYGIDESNLGDDYLRNRLRKKISKWNETEFLLFMDKINEYNQIHRNILHTVKRIYQAWKILDYSAAYLNRQQTVTKFYLIYKLLTEKEFLNPSTDKINGIIHFFSKSHPGKIYRVSDKRYIPYTP